MIVSIITNTVNFLIVLSMFLLILWKAVSTWQDVVAERNVGFRSRLMTLIIWIPLVLLFGYVFVYQTIAIIVGNPLIKF